MKKIFSAIISSSLKGRLGGVLFALLATTTLWAYDFQSGDLYYNITSDTTVKVTYQYEWSSNNYAGLTTVTIPETVTYNATTYSVTSIGDYAFNNCSSLTSITIPNSVTSIGNSAFEYCSSLPVENNLRYADTYLVEAVDETLSTYSIKEGTKWIGSYAFSDCDSLTSITIPNSVTSIEGSAFSGCSSLTSITIPNSVTSIGNKAFNGTAIYKDESNWKNDVLYIDNCLIVAKTSISGVYTIKENTRLIVDYAFYNCYSLTSITIPNSVTSIGDEAFSICKSLTSVTIPNSVTSIEKNAFWGCSSLASMVVESGNNTYDSRENCNAIIETATNTLIAGCQNTIIPNSVTSIGHGAFSICKSLTSITIPNSVTSIEGSAFYYCSSLTSITIPNSVTSIGSRAFGLCDSLTSITVEKGNSIYDSRENCNAVIETATNTLIAGCQNTIIPNSVTSIGDYAFYYCSSLTSITIPNSVTSIGYGAFSSCLSLTSITIPNSVTSIGDHAFYACESLTSITWNAENCSDFTGIWADPFIDIRSQITEFIFGDKVLRIPSYLCYNMNHLTSVTIPNSVTSIGNDAFSVCKSLTSITWNAENYSDITSSDSAPFYDIRSQITEFIFGDKVLRIPSYLCYNMNHLTSITIPNSVTSIGSSAFYSCDALDTICIEATTPPILGSSIFSDSIAICYIPCLAKAMYIASKWANYVELFAEYDFEQTSGVCGEQLYWNYANAKLTITGDGAMFDDLAECIPWNWLQDSIRTIEMNEGITHIADDAFNGCFALRELYLPASVQSIGDNAFAGTPRLYEVTCLAPEPPVAEKSSFTNYDAYFHAYCDAQRYYSVDPVWKKFHNVECIVNENTITNNVTITPSDCEATVVWLSNDAAAAYSLVITKNGVTFCTLRFNKYGQLTNISFAPSRTHNQQQAAESTETGYSFTITGLDAGTKYDYQFSVLNDSNESIDEYFGEFTTQSNTSTDLENVGSQLPMTDCQKILRNGQLLILRDGKTYNTMGAEIR